MDRNFVKTVLAKGGTITPLMISPKDSGGLGLCNPSIFVDNGELWCILRNVNYTLYHCENGQVFNNRWGPLSYLNPENDLHLRTTNFLLKLKPDLSIERYWKINTSKLDKEPLWEFVGLEDARLVRWDGKLYGIGVRRDTTTNGQGRMELSRLEHDERFNRVTETARYRIETAPPANPDWYCEKNWMPITDMPYHFVKFTNPAEVVKCDIETLKSWRPREVDESSVIPDLPFLRGGSQVIPCGRFRICIVHEVDLKKNYLDQKDAAYRHRFVTWDKEWNPVRIMEPFSFMGGEIEFSCGLAVWNDDLLISFGFQDNCAFILRVPAEAIPGVLGIDKMEWGCFASSPTIVSYISDEVITRDIYQIHSKVREGDTVLDIGASAGPFIWNIRNSKAKWIIAVEPDSRLIGALARNCHSLDLNVSIVPKGIADTDGKIVSRGLFKNQHFHSGVTEGDPIEIDGIRFKTLIEENKIGRIDFLKTDCEGGEYDIFNDENFDWIKKHVGSVAGEFHLHNETLKNRWVHFRDTYLKSIPNYKAYSADGIDITGSVWSDEFAAYYKMIMLYMDNAPKARWRSTDWPTLEVTTSIPDGGCPMHCTFCPQHIIDSVYDGVPYLSYEGFTKLIAKVPKEVQITFAGFCEPFINPSCAAMIRHAHDIGHPVSVFTTGVGMSVSDYERIHEIPFSGVQGGFVLHLPDAEGNFAKNGWNGYRELLDAIKREPPANFQTVTMGTLTQELRSLFPYTIRQSMYSRAGNVDRKDVIKTDPKPSSTCGCQERLYHNVLLPNGDLALCCMDYSLRHILGNLFESDYEDIIPDEGTCFELCRHCENGKHV